uniref:Uncharacterized protein n=1 Tax=Rangifer tarandus platyrhynchus TaxID=3082113 RepID=A0ACB0FL74_RANTA|nr:unnamed protein product [Rangifer tarandus platyrhynchus]
MPLPQPPGTRVRPPPPVTSAETGRDGRKSEGRTDKRQPSATSREIGRGARPTFTIYRAGRGLRPEGAGAGLAQRNRGGSGGARGGLESWGAEPGLGGWGWGNGAPPPPTPRSPILDPGWAQTRRFRSELPCTCVARRPAGARGPRPPSAAGPTPSSPAGWGKVTPGRLRVGDSAPFRPASRLLHLPPAPRSRLLRLQFRPVPLLPGQPSRPPRLLTASLCSLWAA